MNMVTNLRYNVADKIGCITGLGYKLEADANVMTLQGTDGRSCAQNDVLHLFGTIPCILSDAERYLPTN